MLPSRAILELAKLARFTHLDSSVPPALCFEFPSAAAEHAPTGATETVGCTTENPAYAQCSASSVYASNAIGHSHGKGRLDSDQAWSAQNNAVGQWWQMDLGSTKSISGVVTQGRTAHNQYVTGYKVKVSSDASTWTDVDGGKTFTANIAANNDKVKNTFGSAVNGRYVRLMVQTWNGHLSMRAAVITGCAGANSGDDSGLA